MIGGPEVVNRDDMIFLLKNLCVEYVKTSMGRDKTRDMIHKQMHVGFYIFDWKHRSVQT